MKHLQPLKNKKEQGVFMVLLALLITAIVLLTGAVIGLGILSSSKTRLLDATNLAALAALEGYVNSPNPSSMHDARVADGINRAREILAANKLAGTQNPIQNIGYSPLVGSGGVAAYGTWYQSQPVGIDPCGGAYPCFVEGNPSSTPGTTINAVKLSVNTEPNDPIDFPFGNFFGLNGFNINASAIAAIVPRCAAYVMDLSISVQVETHKPYRAAPPNPCINISTSSCEYDSANPTSCCDPTNPGGLPVEFCNQIPSTCVGTACCAPSQMALPESLGGPNKDNFGFYALTQANLPVNCQSPNLSNPYLSAEGIAWCNYPQFRTSAYGTGTPPDIRHYQDDYELESAPVTPGGPNVPVWVEKFHAPPAYTGPQPFSNNMLAFNAGLRRMQATQSGTDSSVVVMFSDVIRDKEPGTGLTNDLGYLIQLTNMDNAGRIVFSAGANVPDPAHPKIHPNFVDKGWFPSANSQNTNIVLALLDAANTLTNFCPPLSSKSIILATDGVSSLYSNSTGTGYVPILPAGSPPTFSYYRRAEAQLLFNNIGPGIPSIRTLLQQREISLTTILDGSGIRPNYFNISSNNPACGTWTSGTGFTTDNPACYLSYDQARALGFSGQGGGGTQAFVSSASYDDTGAPTAALDQAFNNFTAGNTGWIFGSPVGLFTQLAIDTGGFICPMLEPGPVSNYVNFYNDRGGAACDSDLDANPANDCNKALHACSPCVLQSRFREPCPQGGSCDDQRNALTVAPTLQSKAEQAAACARVAVGLNPYTLVAE